MEGTEKSSVTVKLEGFKTYKKTTIVGPLDGLIGIFGKNGSGKTNLVSALKFLFDLNLKEKYSPPLNQLFTQLSPQIENSFIKIGLILTRKSLIYNFTKIIDYSSNTEYFLNNKKVSLKKFAIESSRFKFDKFKKITSIFGRYTNCFDSNLIYELIEKFSNKTKTFSEIIKISFLEEKLQENYLFYSKKLKFINEEKMFLFGKLKKLKILDSKKTFNKKKEFLRNFYKIHWFTNKIWKGFEKLNQSFKSSREFLLGCKNLDKFFELKKIVVKNKNFILQNNLVWKLKKFFEFNYWIINSNFIQTLHFLEGKHFLSFSKNKLNHHNTHEISSLQYKLDRKNSINEYAAFKLDSFFSKKNLAKQGNLRKNIGLNKKIFFFFIKYYKIFIEIHKIFFINKQKNVGIKFFFYTISLVFLFSTKKKKKKIFNLKKKENAQKIFSAENGMRGNILKMFKPLDSKYRCVCKKIFRMDQYIFLVDSLHTINFFLKKLNSYKKSLLFFYPVKSSKKVKNDISNLSKNRIFIDMNTDYDEYDSFIPNLIFKLSLKQSFALNPYHNIRQKTKSSDIKTNFIQKLVSKQKFKGYFNQQIIEQSYLVKAKLKKFFAGITSEINNLVPYRKLIEKKIIFLKVFRRFLDLLNKKQDHLARGSNNKFHHIWFNDIFFFKKKLADIFNLHEYLKFKTKAFEKFKTNKYVWSTENRKIFSNIITNFGNYVESKLFKTTTINRIHILFSLVKKSHIHFFLLKKIFKTRMKSSINHLELSSLFKFMNEIRKIRNNFGRKKSYYYERMIKYSFKKINNIKSGQKDKNNILVRAEHIIKKILEKNLSTISTFPKNPIIISKYDCEKKCESFFGEITSFLIHLDLLSKTNKYASKFNLLKKFKIKDTRNSFVDKMVFESQFNFLKMNFKKYKKKLVKNRKNYFIMSQKRKALKIKKEKNFLNYFENWSKLVRIIYKNLTTSNSNPSGGTVFFDYIQAQNRKKGQIIFSIIPVSKTIKNDKFLSDGEQTLAALAVFLAFNYLILPPLIILDELDSQLDPLNLEKFFWFLKRLEKKKHWNMIIITQNKDFENYFSELAGIYKISGESRINLIKP